MAPPSIPANSDEVLKGAPLRLLRPIAELQVEWDAIFPFTERGPEEWKASMAADRAEHAAFMKKMIDDHEAYLQRKRDKHVQKQARREAKRIAQAQGQQDTQTQTEQMDETEISCPAKKQRTKSTPSSEIINLVSDEEVFGGDSGDQAGPSRTGDNQLETMIPETGLTSSPMDISEFPIGQDDVSTTPAPTTAGSDLSMSLVSGEQSQLLSKTISVRNIMEQSSNLSHPQPSCGAETTRINASKPLIKIPIRDGVNTSRTTNKKLRNPSRCTMADSAKTTVEKQVSPARTHPTTTLAMTSLSSMQAADLSSLGRIRKRAAPATGKNNAVVPTRERTSAPFAVLSTPAWVYNVRKRDQDRADRSVVTYLTRIKETINSFNSTAQSLEKLTDLLQGAHFAITVDEASIAKAKILDGNDGNEGLLKILRSTGHNAFPDWVISDARELFIKWSARHFSTDPLLGIKTGSKGPSISFGQVRADYHGTGKLVNGQWWPMQMCAVRDGAHGATQGGIYGIAGKGTYSIVLSGGASYGYADEDSGDSLWYSGTDGKDGAASENTKRLIESADMRPAERRPVRVLRSANMPALEKYRPERGIRYDGLYFVDAYLCVDQALARYKFHLKRCPGQMEIRYQGLAARPCKSEIEAYEGLRAEGRFGGA